MILALLVELKHNSRFLNITENPVHDSLEWLKFVDETNSTDANASEKSCNWAE